MICPLKFNSNTLDLDGNLKRSTSCLCERKECGFYIEGYEKCCILVISEYLTGIANGIDDLVNILSNKMESSGIGGFEI